MPERPIPEKADQLRSDARKNRDLILTSALEAFTESSTASMNSIAIRAGVGIGTLYRHFPTREALVLEVYRTEVEQLANAAPRLLQSESPIGALRAWMERLAADGMAKSGLSGALDASAHDGLVAESYGPIVGALSMLLEANERAGTIRTGVDPDDVLLMLGALWRIDRDSDWRARSGRLLDLLIDGLRAGAANPDPK